MNGITRSLRMAMGALMVFTLGCSDTGGAGGPTDPAEQTFATALGVNLSQMTRTSSGLYTRDEVVGNGAVATVGSTALVDYSGWLVNGNQFDSGTFAVVNLGNAQVIQGWNEGLVGMRVGGRRLLVIPSTLGYGSRGSGPIPPYANLVFRVTLRSVS